MAEKGKIDFKHILIEIGVITIGILIAYQLNSWNDSRSVRSSEQNILREIKSNLELDLYDLSGNQSGHENGISFIDSLNLAAESGLYNERIPFYIFRSFRDYIFLPQTGAFETLKSKGVDLIGNDSLRIKILRLYDFQYNALIQMEGTYQPGQFHEDFRYIVENYFLDFDLENFETIKPRYNNSEWLKNADVKVRLDLVKRERKFFNRTYLGVIDEVNSLILAIEEELSK